MEGNQVEETNILFFEWKDGSSSCWILPLLAELKDAFPVQRADFVVVANDLTTESAIHWWVPFVLKKQEQANTQDGQYKILANLVA